jgi:hypothetical protein
VQVADDLSVELGLGTKTGGDASDGFMSYAATATYAIGAAMRTPRYGVVGGVRATAGIVKVADTRGAFATLPVFARGEWMVGTGSVALELDAAPIGDAHLSATLLIDEQSRSGGKTHRYCAIRVQRLGVDGEVEVHSPGGTTTILAFEDSEVTEYSFSFGWGF